MADRFAKPSCEAGADEPIGFAGSGIEDFIFTYCRIFSLIVKIFF